VGVLEAALTDTIDHEVTITVQAWAWPIVSKAIRAIREAHRDLGGTSSLRRNGETVTFGAKGSADAVLTACAAVVKIAAGARDARAKMRERLGATLAGAQERRHEQAKDAMLDALLAAAEKGWIKA
jgi:hypothetical protein